MVSLCVVLHMCWRARLVDDYSHTAAKWNASAIAHPQLGVFFVDSCRKVTDRHPLETDHVHRLPF